VQSGALLEKLLTTHAHLYTSHLTPGAMPGTMSGSGVLLTRCSMGPPQPNTGPLRCGGIDHFVMAITSGRAIVRIVVGVLLRNLGVDILIKHFVELKKNAEN